MQKIVKKLPFLFIIFFLLYMLLGVIQNQFFVQRDIELYGYELSKYCNPNQLLHSCSSIINLDNLKYLDPNQLVYINYHKFDLIFKILKWICCLINLGLFLFFTFRNDFFIQKTYKNISFYTILIFAVLSVYKFFYLYSNNVSNIRYYFWIFVFASCFLILLFFALYRVLNIVLKNGNMALLYTLLITFFMYNTNFVHLEELEFAGIFLILISKFNIDNLITFIKYFSLSLMIILIFNGTSKFVSGKIFSNNVKEIPLEYKITKSPQRDIYILLLDMYAGQNTLDFYGYDNSEFFDELRQSGFTVYDNMESNYNKTTLSIATILNLKYAQNIKYDDLCDSINNAELFKIAKNTGYKIYYINSWPMNIRLNDKYIDSGYTIKGDYKTSLLNLFLKDTCFKILIPKNTSKHIDEALFILNNIIENNDKSKKFVFAHFLMPHDPFLYDENGNDVSKIGDDYTDNNETKLINKGKYISYLKYANRQTLSIVQKLLSKRTQPVIIIWGDHGSRTKKYIANDKLYRSEISKNSRYAFNTILAYYNPEKNNSCYKKTDCLINFFINFVDDMFGTDIKNVKFQKFYIYMDTSTDNIHNLKGEYIKR